MKQPQAHIMALKPKSEALMGSFPTEQRFVRDVQYPPEGGIESFFHNEKYPEKQLVYPEVFGYLNPFKKSFLLPFRILKNKLGWMLVLWSLVLFLNKKFRKLVFKEYVEMWWSGWMVIGFTPAYFCVACRELARAGLTFAGGGREKERFVYMLVGIFECDNAYRYRMQDVAGIIDKEKFLAAPIKETKRVIAEYEKRELLEVVKNKVGMMKWFIFGALCLPGIRKMARAFFKEVDLEKVKPDAGDKYWSYHRLDYNFDGLDLIDRMRRKSLMKLK